MTRILLDADINSVFRGYHLWKKKLPTKNVLFTFLAFLVVTTLFLGFTTSSYSKENDPWESANRKIYEVNNGIDHRIFYPALRIYANAIPSSGHRCISNFFSNADDIWSSANSLLQGQYHNFLNTIGRFLLNSTLGIGGCFDVASHNNIEKINNDFSLTLALWGIDYGQYLVLPVFGPSSTRDISGRVVDWAADPIGLRRIYNTPWYYPVKALKVMDARASVLHITDIIDRIALDSYSFVREAYLKRRFYMKKCSENNANKYPPHYEDFDENQIPGYPIHIINPLFTEEGHP